MKRCLQTKGLRWKRRKLPRPEKFKAKPKRRSEQPIAGSPYLAALSPWSMFIGRK